MMSVYRKVSSSSTASAAVATTWSRIAPTFHQTTHFSKLARSVNLKAIVKSHYHQGKFHNLFPKVVAKPSVLLLACQNLKHAENAPHRLTCNCVSTNFFSLDHLASQLSTGKFDIQASCFSMPASSTSQGDSLLLPNLQLKVLIEAIRMVLEIVYDHNFVSFCYGGRAGMGRHTAIRYIKSSLQNISWWFTVSFNRKKFGSEHVDKLCMFIDSRIKDSAMIETIKKLFETGVLRIELGACFFGRGFVQECGLSSMLMNIYFHGFDEEIEKSRLEIDRENPEFCSKDLAGGMRGNVSFRPTQMYVVRYLDEILFATSGTKWLMKKLKNKFVMYLEQDLELSVDKVETVLRSAVSDNIDFMGMELQAVTPSVLHPPMSDKAIRARKKYFRREEVKRMEVRNAMETMRKKVAMRIMKRQFINLKKGINFKFDFQIENEVKQIFHTWAVEAVQEYLESIEVRAEWYRHLTAGDFLSLERIRNQLPLELVSSYDNFQEQVDKHLNPIEARRALAEKERLKKELEEQKYAARTVADLTQLCIKVDAPKELVRRAVQSVGITNHMGRPRPISFLFALEDADIIKWYAGVGRRWLDYFRCCHNFNKVKTIVSYHLRFSCLLTLKEKHELTKIQTIRRYTKDLKTFDLNGAEKLFFPTEREVKLMRKDNLADPKPVDGTITMALIRLATDEPPYRCVAHFCSRTDTTVYRIRLLPNTWKVEKVGEGKGVLGMVSIHQNLNRKCLPLCSDHISKLYLGRLTFQDIDCASFVDVD